MRLPTVFAVRAFSRMSGYLRSTCATLCVIVCLGTNCHTYTSCEDCNGVSGDDDAHSSGSCTWCPGNSYGTCVLSSTCGTTGGGTATTCSSPTNSCSSSCSLPSGLQHRAIALPSMQEQEAHTPSQFPEPPINLEHSYPYASLTLIPMESAFQRLTDRPRQRFYPI